MQLIKGKQKSKNVKDVKEYLLNYRGVYYLENFDRLSNYGKVWRLEHPD
jgi:hypothetical protein